MITTKISILIKCMQKGFITEEESGVLICLPCPSPDILFSVTEAVSQLCRHRISSHPERWREIFHSIIIIGERERERERERGLKTQTIKYTYP